MSGFNANATNENETVYTTEAGQAQPQAQTAKGLKSTSELFASASRATLTGNSASGSLKDLKENIEAALEELDDKAFELHIINDSSQLAAPAVLITSTRKGEMKYFSVVAEGLLHNGELSMIDEYINGAQVKVDMPASKVWDADYHATVQRALAAKTQKDIGSINPTYFVALNNDRDLTDVGIGRWVLDTAIPCIDDHFESAIPLQREFLAHPEVEIGLKSDFHGPGVQVLNSEGEVVAADVTLSVVARDKKADKYRQNGGGNAASLVSTNLRIDLIKDDRRAGGQFGYGAQQFGQVQEPNRCFHPVLIMGETEGLSQSGGRAIENVYSQALAVASTVLLATGKNFMNIFTRSPENKAMLSNLGYLASPLAQVHQPAPLVIEDTLQPTQEGNWVPEWVEQCYFHQTITLAQDIRLGGRSAWTQQLLLAVANGVEGANDALISVFNDLFPGFSDLWAQSGGGALISPNTVVIHNGNYSKKDGELRDVREIGQLWTAGVMKEQSADPVTGTDPFNATFLPGATNGTEGLIKLHKRREDIKAFAGKTVKFTGLSTRVFYDPRVLSVLGQAMIASGVRMNPEDMGETQSTQQLLAGFQAGTSVDFTQMSSVFQQQFQNPGHTGNFYQHNLYAAPGFYQR